jgi:hypothetical protein
MFQFGNALDDEESEDDSFTLSKDNLANRTKEIPFSGKRKEKIDIDHELKE